MANIANQWHQQWQFEEWWKKIIYKWKRIHSSLWIQFHSVFQYSIYRMSIFHNTEHIHFMPEMRSAAMSFNVKKYNIKIWRRMNKKETTKFPRKQKQNTRLPFVHHKNSIVDCRFELDVSFSIWYGFSYKFCFSSSLNWKAIIMRVSTVRMPLMMSLKVNCYSVWQPKAFVQIFGIKY